MTAMSWTPGGSRLRRWEAALFALTLFGLPSLAAAQETVTYYTTDAVGSVRMVTDAGGAVIARYDYRPFGDPCGSACGPQGTTEKRLFAGKEKDAETGLDYFGARHYANGLGRLTTTDPIAVIDDSLVNPQRWNRYAYALNNPLRYVDPDGRYVTDCAIGDAQCNANAADFEEARQRDLKSRVRSVRAAASAYGAYGVKNGVTIHFDPAVGGAVTDPFKSQPGNPDIDVWFNPDVKGLALQQVLAHEGAHVQDDLRFVLSEFDQRLNPTYFQTELHAFTVGAFVKPYEYSNVTCGGSNCSFTFGPRDTSVIQDFLRRGDLYRRGINGRVFSR